MGGRYLAKIIMDKNINIVYILYVCFIIPLNSFF